MTKHKKLVVAAAVWALTSVSSVAYADNKSGPPLSPLNAIRREIATKYKNLSTPVRIVSMQQAGDTILVAIGIGETGSYLVLKRDVTHGGWSVVSGGGGALSTAAAPKKNLTQSDVANFVAGRSEVLVPSPGFHMSPGSVTAKATMLITPAEKVVIQPQQQSAPP